MNTKTEKEIRLENLEAELNLAKLTDHVMRQAYLKIEIVKLKKEIGEKK